MSEKKEFNQIKNAIAIKAIGEIMLTTIITIILLIILGDGIFNDGIAESVASVNQGFYRFLVTNKTIVMIILFAIIFTINTFLVIRHTMNHMVEILKATDKILKRPEEEIKLSGNLISIENQLNKIRIDLITSQNKAKESEAKKNDLIMYMAHDLKTPLTSVIGYLSLLTEEKEISKPLQEKYLHLVLKKALRVEELTNQFFDITRYNLSDMPINRKTIDLSMLLDQLVDECYPMLTERNLTCLIQKPNQVMYLGDGDKLARAFENLLKNAIYYSFEQTEIKIEVIQNEKNIKIIFQNQGEKIPSFKLDKIFEKFYRADESRTSHTGGAGLGLAITKQIIELHQGTITVQNEDEWIIFTVQLPISDLSIAK